MSYDWQICYDVIITEIEKIINAISGENWYVDML